MLKRPPLQPDPTLEPALALLVRSMRTALGPAEDEEFAEAAEVSRESDNPVDSSVPAAGIVRVPTIVRAKQLTPGRHDRYSDSFQGLGNDTGTRRNVTPTDGYDVPADTDNPLLSGVLRRTRQRSGSLPRIEAGVSGMPSISPTPPGEPLRWDELNEPVSDPEVDAFLSAPESVPVRPQQAGMVTEAPTPFAPASYASWSERNSRGD